MASLRHSLRKVKIIGFRSARNVQLNLESEVNLFAGLNDHGKSNLFRALHLFLTGEVEPGVPLDYERDVCRIGDKASAKITIAIMFNSQVAHKKLLESIGRTQLQKTEAFIVRKVWSRQPGGFSMRTDVLLRRSSKKEMRVYTDSDYSGIGEEIVRSPKAPKRFRDELERLFKRFRVRYLPSSTTGTLFEEAGLATEVKRYLLDSYSKKKEFKELGNSIKGLRAQFDSIVKAEFGDRIASQIKAVFPGLQSANLQLPSSDEDLVFTRDLTIHRDGKPVGISSCGSGLQSIFVLQTLKFLDSNIRNRASELTPIVVWLIEEPEAFLYEDLVHSVGDSLTEAAKLFNVLVTTHSRELVNSVKGGVSWVSLSDKGTTIPKSFDLSSEAEKQGFASYASRQFGKSWLEIQYEATVAQLSQARTKPILFVEGESDEIIIRRLFEIFPINGGIEIKKAITNTSSNAEHVMKSVIEVSRLVEDRPIIGLFDNDIEGRHYYDKLVMTMEGDDFAACNAVILPCPPSLHKAELGVQLPGGKTEDSGKRIDLNGVGVTIEALLDSSEVVELLKKENYIEDYWIGSRGGKQTDVTYSNLTVHGKQRKTQIARDVAGILDKRNAGSLADLCREIRKTLED